MLGANLNVKWQVTLQRIVWQWCGTESHGCFWENGGFWYCIHLSVAVIFHFWVLYQIIFEFQTCHDCVSSHTSFLMSCGESCLLTRQSTAFSACHHTRDRILYLEPWITCPSPRHFMESQICKPRFTGLCNLHYTTVHYTTLIC